MENFKEKFDKLLMSNLNISQEQIVPDAAFKADLGVDSLDMMELIIEFEKVFFITIPDEDIDKLITVDNAEQYLKARVNIN